MEDTKEKTSTKSTFVLPEKSVNLKFIERKKGMASNVGSDHVISGGMLNGSFRSFTAPLLRNGSIANVLTREEKETVEKLTGLDLSVYGDFWKEHRVKLFKGDNSLLLSNPMDYISYKILGFCKDEIAPNWQDRNNKQTYEFAIVEEGDLVAEKKSNFNSKKEAFILYGKVMDDKEKLIGILKLLSNKPISANTSLDWVQSQVGEYVDTMPTSFINLMKDTSLETKLLINEGVEKGIIKKTSNKYSTVDGLDLCENGQIPTFDNAVKYLETPKHQEVRSLIEAKIRK